MGRSSARRRRALNIGVALLVAAVLVTTWWLARPTSGTGVGVAAGGGGGSAGAGVPGDPGSPEPSPHQRRTEPAVRRDPVLVPGAVRVDSYVARGERLRLTYTTGVPECYGEVEVAEVEDRGDAVVVALRAVPPVTPAEQCIDLAVVGTIAVDLAGPLDGRRVLDGGFEPEVPVLALEAGPGDGRR